MNDVHYKGKFRQIGNKPAKSAKIDHIVVGPTGVYVIETKNWSAKQVKEVFNKNDYTPYNQIERNNRLVFDYLRNRSMNVKIRSIIAVHGANIPLEREQKCCVIRTNELSSHIQKGNKVLSIEEVNNIADELFHLVMSKNPPLTLEQQERNDQVKRACRSNYPLPPKPKNIKKEHHINKNSVMNEKVHEKTIKTAEIRIQSNEYFDAVKSYSSDHTEPARIYRFLINMLNEEKYKPAQEMLYKNVDALDKKAKCMRFYSGTECILTLYSQR